MCLPLTSLLVLESVFFSLFYVFWALPVSQAAASTAANSDQEEGQIESVSEIFLSLSTGDPGLAVGERESRLARRREAKHLKQFLATPSKRRAVSTAHTQQRRE